MTRATLEYVIGNHSIQLETLPLINIDNYTSTFKNEGELLDNYPKKYKVLDFIESSQRTGRFEISYVTGIDSRNRIPIMYNSNKKVELEDNGFYNQESEIERARKLLFNSKNSIFQRLFLSNNSLKNTLNVTVILDYDAFKICRKLGIPVILDGALYKVDLATLVRYRIDHKKLGPIRNIYESLLDEWKYMLKNEPSEDVYFYSREIKLLIETYDRVKNNHLSVDMLKVHDKAQEVIRQTFRVSQKYSRHTCIRNTKQKRKLLEAA